MTNTGSDASREAPPWLVPRAAYVHIPFCRTKCVYCDFNTYAGKERLIGEYVAALAQEVEASARASAGAPLHTVYFGGGTPSLLRVAQVRRLLGALHRACGVAPGAEVTLEANPGTFGQAYLEALVALGVTRLSLGIQSLDDETLRRLARTHNAATAIGAVDLARGAGVRSVNADLIYGLPWQTPERWLRDLRTVLDTEPDHISLYALTVETGTPLHTLVARGRWRVPDADGVADMYEAALAPLERAGYRHYEVSNWARPGHESRHNLTYWRNEAYLGCGAGAHSYVHGRRAHNVRSIEEYVRRVGTGRPLVAGEETLDAAAQLGETAVLALRLRHEGIEFDRFRTRFGIEPRTHWSAELRELAEVGVIEVGPDRARLTDAGLLVSNAIGARFL
jgi:oxygen-independent coproporphyrinogen-3 oxidase